MNDSTTYQGAAHPASSPRRDTRACSLRIGVPSYAFALITLVAVALLPGTTLADPPGNGTPDVPWRDGKGKDRPKECCGTVAVTNLLIQLDKDHGRTVKDGASTDKVKDEAEKATNDDDKPSEVSNVDVAKGVKSLLKKRGYQADVKSIIQEGEDKVTFERLVKEFKDDERLLLLIESSEDGTTPDDGIRHWVLITNVDESGKKISVTDPNTGGDQSDNPNDPGSADTYDVDIDNFRFALGYDFASEDRTRREGSTRVKVIDIVKVSDVDDSEDSPEETGGGGTKGKTEVKERSGKAEATISPVIIDSLFEDASIPGGVDSVFIGDTILGGLIRLSDLTLENPLDVTTEGALLSGGTVEFVAGGEVQLSASFEAVTLADSNDPLANQAVLDDLQIPNTIGSAWLEQFAMQFLTDPTLVPQLFLRPEDDTQSLLAQLGYFQSLPFGPVDIGVFFAASRFLPGPEINVRSVVGRSLSVGAVAEPASALLVGIGLALIVAGRIGQRRRETASRSVAPAI